MQKKLPKIISQEEFEKVLKATEKKEYKVAFLLGFESGLRLSEIVGFKDKVPKLSKENVSLEQNTIRVISGKGGKDRIVPLPKRFNINALKLLPLKMSRRSLQSKITEIGEEVLNKKITFHTLRHGFGSHLAGKGMPLHQIQMLMGHSRLDTTGIYLHANPKESIDKSRELF